MQLGISSYTFGWAFSTTGQHGKLAMDELDLLLFAVSMGVPVLQIGDNLPLHTFSQGRMQALKTAMEIQHTEVEAGARKMTPPHLERYVRICKEIGSRLLRFVVDGKGYQPSLQDIISTVRSQLPALEQAGITLALENHDRFKAADLRHIIESVGSQNVGICLDTANSFGALEHIDNVTRTLAPYTVNLHIKDHGISRLGHGQGFIIDGRVAGEGLLDIPRLIRKIGSFQRCQTCILEQWVPPERTIQTTLEKEKLWAERSIKYLKEVLENPGKKYKKSD